MRIPPIVYPALALCIAGACAKATTRSPGDDDASGGSGGTTQTGTGTGTTTTTTSVTPSCYAGLGDCDPLQSDCATGEACDIDGATLQFACFPPPNTVTEGGSCDSTAGPFCMNGLTCVNYLCAHFCCDDGDCGGTTCTLLDSTAGFDVLACQ
jgi:hypothetical protein